LQFFITPPTFAQLTKVKTSYSALTANLTAYWLAKEAKLFEKQGLDVDVVLIESGVTTIQALVAGETQIAMGGGTVAVSSGLAGGDLISIASIENSFPYALVALKDIQFHHPGRLASVPNRLSPTRRYNQPCFRQIPAGCRDTVFTLDRRRHPSFQE